MPACARVCVCVCVCVCVRARVYIYIDLSMYQFSSGPPVTGFRLPHLSVYASPQVKFLCCITLSTSFPTLLLVFLVVVFLPVTRSISPSATAMPNTCPYHLNIFSVPFKIVRFTLIFSLMTSFLTLIVRSSLQLLSNNPFLYLTFFLLFVIHCQISQNNLK